MAQGPKYRSHIVPLNQSLSSQLIFAPERENHGRYGYEASVDTQLPTHRAAQRASKKRSKKRRLKAEYCSYMLMCLTHIGPNRRFWLVEMNQCTFCRDWFLGLDVILERFFLFFSYHSLTVTPLPIFLHIYSYEVFERVLMERKQHSDYSYVAVGLSTVFDSMEKWQKLLHFAVLLYYNTKFGGDLQNIFSHHLLCEHNCTLILYRYTSNTRLMFKVNCNLF